MNLDSNEVIAGMETIRVRNPRNGQFDYEFPVPEPEALARRVGELRAAQQAWAAESVELQGRDRCDAGRSNCWRIAPRSSTR